jgi:hypothetical protein
MTTILPEKNRKEIKKNYILGFFNKFMVSLIVIASVWVVMEATLYYAIRFERDVIFEQDELQDQKVKNDLINEYREKTKDVKSLTDLFTDDKESKIEIMDFIFSVKKPEISINSFSVEIGETATFVGVGGVADSRDSLSEFKNILENDSRTEQVDLPVSSFTKTFDIPFSITFVYIYEKSE